MGKQANARAVLKRFSGRVFSLCLLPVDLLRVTWLFMSLTVRFAGRFYLHLLSPLRGETRPVMAFRLSRPRLSPEVWDDQLRFEVRRALSLKTVVFFCGLHLPGLKLPDSNKEGSCPVLLSVRQYLRFAGLTGLMWTLLIGGGLLLWKPAFLHRDGEGLPAAEYSRSERRAKAFIGKAEDLVEQRAYLRARIQYLNAIQQEPDELAAQWGLAQCKLHLGQLTEARQALERVVSLDPAHQEARATLIDLLLRQGRARPALQHAMAAVEREPADVEAIVRLGKCRQLLGHLAEAGRQSERALALSPDHPGALLLAAAIAADAGECDRAQKYVARVLTGRGEAEPDRLVVARILGKCKDYGAALAQIQQVLEKNPAHWVAAQEKAELYLAQGNIEKAIWEYQKLAGHDSAEPAVQIRLAQLLLKSGRLDEAHQLGETLIRRIPQSKVGHLVLAMVYYQKGLYLSCAEQCRASLKREPESVAGRRLLARALMQQKQYDQAIRWLVELKAEDRQDPEVLLLLAECHVARQEKAEALQALDEAITLQPDSEIPYLLQARLYLDEGNHVRAQAAYERVLERNDQNVQALNNLAVLLSASRPGLVLDLSRAFKLAVAAWSLQPGNPEIAETLGWIQALREEYSAAFYLLSYAVRRQPYKAETRVCLAHVLEGLKRYEEAVCQLDLAQELSSAVAYQQEFKTLRASLARHAAEGGPKP